jgi:Domain of unknown function (DUF4919)
MKIKVLLTVSIIFLVCLTILAQDTENKQKSELDKQDSKSAKRYAAKDYDDQVAKLKIGDANIDFTALRMGFVATKAYSYHGPDKAEKEKFLKPLNDKKWKDALKEAEKFLGKNYAEPNAHHAAYLAAKELKDEKATEFHMTVLLGLLNSIKNGNDGFSAKTPFLVTTIDEEYTMMRFLGLKFNSQSLQHAEGHTFDVFTATDTKTNEKVTVYFNIDIVWAAETKLFGS